MVKTIGQLNQRVTFQSEATASDGQGGVVSSGWSNIATAPTVWAAIEVKSGGEGEAAARVENKHSVAAFIRIRNDIAPDMRLIWRGNNYAIRDVAPYDFTQGLMVVTAEFGGVGSGS